MACKRGGKSQPGLDGALNYVYLTLLSLAFIGVECFAGGTRLIYSLPAYALLGVAAVMTFFSIRTKASKILPKPACLISSGLFFGYILVRSHFSPVDYLARSDFMMVSGCLVIYLLAALSFTKSKFRMYFIGVLLAIALGQVIVGFIQFSRGNDFELFGYQRYPAGNRASGQYVSPNHLAGYLEVVAIMGMSLVCWSTWKPWAKILAGYVSVLAFAGVAITGSRGGYVSAVFCILVFCALCITVIKMAYPEHLFRVVLIGGAVLLLIGGSLPFIITSQLVKTRSAEIFQKDMRLQLWQAAWKQAQIDPWVGTGSGTYLFYGRKFRNPEVQRDPVRVHNDYLDLLAEYGIVGVAGFVIFLVSHLRSGMHTFFWLVRKRLQFSADWRSSSLALNIGCLCAVAAYLVHSAVDFNLHIPANAMLMAFVFGVLANPGLETSQKGDAAAKTNRVFQFLLPALGLALLAVGILRLPGEYYAEKARVAVRDKQYLGATLAAKEGIQWEQKNPDLYYYLGEGNRNVGYLFPSPALGKSFYAVASDAFKKGIALFPQDERLLLAEGWTLDAMGQSDEAGEYFQQALTWDPNSEQVQELEQDHLEVVKNSPPVCPLHEANILQSAAAVHQGHASAEYKSKCIQNKTGHNSAKTY